MACKAWSARRAAIPCATEPFLLVLLQGMGAPARLVCLAGLMDSDQLDIAAHMQTTLGVSSSACSQDIPCTHMQHAQRPDVPLGDDVFAYEAGGVIRLEHSLRTGHT